MRIFYWAPLCLALSWASVPPCAADTLAEAIASAYRSNPTIETSRYDLRAADEGLVQAHAQLRPNAEVNVNASYGRTVRGRLSQQANPFSPEAFNDDTSQAQVVLNQPLYTGGRATAAHDSALAIIGEEREVLRGAEGDLLLAVITAYVDVRRYAAILVIWKSSVDALAKISNEVEARRVAGELTLTDVAQARAQLSLSEQQVVATEQALEAARTDFAVLVGREATELADEPALPNLPHRVEEAFEAAERQNPELLRAVFTEQQSRSDIVAAKAQGRPTLALRGTAGLSGQAVPYHLHDQDQNYSGGVVFTLPLTAGGQIASQIRQARDRNSSDRFKIESARRQVDRAVAFAWNQMTTAEREAALQEEQRHFADIQLDGMINEYRVGLRSTFDVLYAQQQLRDAQVALLSSRRDKYVSEATVLRQTGLLEAQAVLTGMQLHDPATHLRDVENRNDVPWDRLIAAIDRAGAPSARRRKLAPLPASPRPAVAAAKTEAGHTLVRSFPVEPLTNASGRLITSPPRIAH